MISFDAGQTEHLPKQRLEWTIHCRASKNSHQTQIREEEEEQSLTLIRNRFHKSVLFITKQCLEGYLKGDVSERLMIAFG